jgi:hypothetical protein
MTAAGRLVAAVCMMAATTAQAAEQRAVFRFGWEPGFAATVRHVSSHTNNGVADSSITLTYDLQTEPAGDDLLVRILNRRISTSSTHKGQGKAVELPPLMEFARVSGFDDYLVARDGRFLQLNATADAQTRIAASFSNVFRESAPSVASADIEKYSKALADPRAQLVRAQFFWRDLVGFLRGGDPQLDASYPFEETRGFLQMPAVKPVQLQGEFTVKAAKGCLRGGKSRPCVQFELRQNSTDDANAQLLDFFGAAGGKDHPLQSLNLVVVTRIRLEPEKMIPHELEKRVELIFLTGATGKPEQMISAWHDKVGFTYAAR